MIKDILSGWTNFIDKSEVTEEIAKERAEICATCEHAKKGMLLTFIKDSLKNIEGHYCNDCGGCPLSAKVRTKNDVCEKWQRDTK
jgi:hypothetical protein